MSFSKKTRYGLISLIDLAVNSQNGPVSLGSIAKRNGISQQFLEQIFAAFRSARLVRSVKGPQGGYQLAKSAAEVTVADVLQVFHVDLIKTADHSEPGPHADAGYGVQCGRGNYGLQRCVRRAADSDQVAQ